MNPPSTSSTPRSPRQLRHPTLAPRLTASVRQVVFVSGLLAASTVVAGCGQTYIDSSVTVPPTGVVVTQPAVVYDTAAPLPDLLNQIKDLMSDLDERILDDDHPAEVLAGIDALWAAARPQVAASDPTEADSIDQAIKLARSGVERRRAADASKGYKIYLGLLDHYGSGSPSS